MLLYYYTTIRLYCYTTTPLAPGPRSSALSVARARDTLCGDTISRLKVSGSPNVGEFHSLEQSLGPQMQNCVCVYRAQARAVKCTCIDTHVYVFPQR